MINYGYRLPDPGYFKAENLTLIYENILLKCWYEDQALRPSIAQLNEIFINYFDLLEPDYKFDDAATLLNQDKQVKSYTEMFEEANEVNSDEIGLGTLLKGNSVTEIWKGTFRFDDLIVAIKKFNLSEQENSDMVHAKYLEEFKIMKTLNHPNILKLYGKCSLDPYYLITEYLKYGSVLNFLALTHDPYTNEVLGFNFNTMISMVQDVTNGMRYLGYLNIVHCDLTARNILVGDFDVLKEKYVVKIAGFEKAIALANGQETRQVESIESNSFHTSIF